MSQQTAVWMDADVHGTRHPRLSLSLDASIPWNLRYNPPGASWGPNGLRLGFSRSANWGLKIKAQFREKTRSYVVQFLSFWVWLLPWSMHMESTQPGAWMVESWYCHTSWEELLAPQALSCPNTSCPVGTWAPMNGSKMGR